MKDFEIFFYGSVKIEAKDEEQAMEYATDHLINNVNDYCDIEEIAQPQEV